MKPVCTFAALVAAKVAVALARVETAQVAAAEVQEQWEAMEVQEVVEVVRLQVALQGLVEFEGA